MDQSNRYANLNLKEDDLIAGGKHILCAYKMKPKAGYGYLEAAAHFAAESSTGTNVEVSTTDDFTKGVDALVYQIDEATEDMRIAYPLELFDRNVIDGRMMLVSFLTLTIGNNQGMGDIEYAKMLDFYVPPAYLQLFDGPSTTIEDLWRVLGRPVVDGGYISGTIIKPKLGLRPEPFAKAGYEFWLGGDFIKNDEPQGNQVFAPLKKTVRAGLRRDEARQGRNRRGQAVLDEHHRRRPLRDVRARRIHAGDLRPGRRQGGLPGRRLRRRPRHGHHRAPPVPNQYLHYHRAGHGAVTSPMPSAATPPSCSPRWPPAGRLGHPRRHDGLRQDGRRRRRPDHRLHDRAQTASTARSTIRSGTA